MSWIGSVVGLHTVPRSFLPMKDCETLNLIAGVGIEGDRYSTESGFYSDRPEEGRQVTLFELETLDAIERDYGISLKPNEHRRNITTRDVPLNHLVGKKFFVGAALLEATRLSTPCRHIEQITGKDIFEPMLHRSGLHARILKGAVIHSTDVVRPAG